MKNHYISINPFAEYLEATDSRKNTILKEQENPDPVRIPYYQLAKSRIRQSILKNGSLHPIKSGIKDLKLKKPSKKWQISDQKNSIIALERYIEMVLPEAIIENKIELIKVTHKFLTFKGVRIKISPNVIFRVVIEGKSHVGACKIHVSKGKPFSNKQSQVVATLLNLFLSNIETDENDFVNPELCFCLDPFAGTIINSANKVKMDSKTVNEACLDIIQRWGRGAYHQSSMAS